MTVSVCVWRVFDRQRAEREPLVERRIKRAVKDAANQSKLMAHMAARTQSEEKQKGGAG